MEIRAPDGSWRGWSSNPAPLRADNGLPKTLVSNARHETPRNSSTSPSQAEQGSSGCELVAAAECLG